MLFAKPEAGSAESGVLAVLGAGHGVQMAADGEAGMGCLRRIVDDEEVVEFEGAFPDEEKSADDVGERGWSGKADRDPRHPCSTEDGAKVEAHLIEGDDDAKATPR